ncbi:hypothetical protein GQ53DRAFT_31400 [Thozetella sp. PMI_491]|nr:hypothetical protein GQ53DRAFT_31400 [Thozetella sp. PMI_491]
MLSIFAIVGRVIQCILSIAILGLSASAIAAWVIPPAPTTPKYADFVGAFGIIVAVIGVVSLYVQRISPKIPMGLDAVLALLMLAAGIAYAVGLKGVNCGDEKQFFTLIDNSLINWGSEPTSSGTYYGVYKDTTDGEVAWGRLSDNCKKAFGNELLNFIAFAWSLLMLGLDYVLMRKGGASKSTTYV